MPNYRVVYKEHHQLTLSYIQEFDTKDQAAWEQFRDDAKKNGIDVNNFPKKAPKDPKVWFSLISQLPNDEYPEKEEDIWTMSRGGYDTSLALEDENGKLVK